jgi:hypothetical protein
MALKQAKCDSERTSFISAGYKETDNKGVYDTAITAGGTTGGSIVCEKTGGGTKICFKRTAREYC